MTQKQFNRTYIREWRQHRGLSLRQLAARLEYEPGGDPALSHVSIGRIERGEQPYSQGTLEMLASALGVEPADLLSVHPERKADIIDLRQIESEQLRENIRRVVQALRAG